MSQEQSTIKTKTSPLNIPAAIVITGALIAGAIYFGGQKGGTTPEAQVMNDNNEKQAVKTATRPPQPQIGDIRPVTDEDHIRGAKNAKLTIIGYSDFECPFCKRFHPTLQKIVDEYPNDVRWVHRQFPLDQLHSKASKQAEATECAGEQGKFWELTDKIFAVTPSNNGLDMDTLPQLAQEVGVGNVSQFEECLASGKYADEVAADVADAKAAGGRGTPHSVIIDEEGNKTTIKGAKPYESVKQTVETILNN